MSPRRLESVPAAPDPDAPLPHLEAWTVVRCGLCDDEGYRGSRVCDHVDRTEVVARGMAKVRAVLNKPEAAHGA